MVLIIFYIGMFIWLLPPIKQYRGKLFLYFLVLALADPVSYTLVISLKTNVYQIYGIFTFASVLAVSIHKISKKNIIYLSIGFILTFIVIITQIRNIVYLYLAILHLVILWVFLKETLISFSKNNYLILGWAILILYEISVVLKLIIFLEIRQTSVIYYALTTGFQILIAIFFTIYKVEESPKIKLSL